MIYTRPGPENTGATLETAVSAAKERGIGHIVVASNTGATASGLIGCGLQVVCVAHANGFAKPGENEMPEDARRQLEAAGFRVYVGAHVLSGAERGLSRRLGGIYPVEIIAYSLRMLGQGAKVCVETSVMALDAGLIPYGVPVVAIGGTGRGADTAAILTPAHSNAILETKIHEILCKPSLL